MEDSTGVPRELSHGRGRGMTARAEPWTRPRGHCRGQSFGSAARPPLYGRGRGRTTGSLLWTVRPLLLTRPRSCYGVTVVDAAANAGPPPRTRDHHRGQCCVTRASVATALDNHTTPDEDASLVYGKRAQRLWLVGTVRAFERGGAAGVERLPATKGGLRGRGVGNGAGRYNRERSADGVKGLPMIGGGR